MTAHRLRSVLVVLGVLASAGIAGLCVASIGLAVEVNSFFVVVTPPVLLPGGLALACLIGGGILGNARIGRARGGSWGARFLVFAVCALAWLGMAAVACGFYREHVRQTEQALRERVVEALFRGELQPMAPEERSELAQRMFGSVDDYYGGEGLVQLPEEWRSASSIAGWCWMTRGAGGQLLVLFTTTAVWHHNFGALLYARRPLRRTDCSEPRYPLPDAHRIKVGSIEIGVYLPADDAAATGPQWYQAAHSD